MGSVAVMSHLQDELIVVNANGIGGNRRLAAERTAGREVPGVQVKRADDLLEVELPVRERAALVRAHGGERPDRAVAEPEHGDHFAVDRIAAAFPQRDVVDRADDPQRLHARTGTWGSTVSGSEVRNCPGVTGSARSFQGS